MNTTSESDSEKLLYKLIFQFSIFTRGLNEFLEPHLLTISSELKKGINYHELNPELKALSKTLTHISKPDNKVSHTEVISSTLSLQKNFIKRLDELLAQTDIPLKFKRQYSLLSQKSKTELNEQDSNKVIDLALNLLSDIKDHAVSEQQGLEDFLTDISKQFNSLENQAGNVSKSNEQSIENRESLSDAINNQVNNIKESAENAKELTSLKENINQHLQEITVQLNKHQESEIDRQLENNVQLKQMSQKLKDMEIESDTLRSNLKIAHDKALSDSLTGLPNRTAYDERARLEFNRWNRYKNPLSLIIWDIDLFKLINDNYGHKAGDKTLALVAQLISKNCRDTDFIARYGGEEFVMLLPNTRAEHAMVAAEKIRAIIGKSGFNHQGQSITLTISCGISEFSEGDQHDTVFERADQALYQSKENGRNRCTIKNN